MKRYPRNMIGYGATPPDAGWPGGARIAVQFVLNYEEGGENNVLHGDPASEAFLSEIVGAAAWTGQRHWNMESASPTYVVFHLLKMSVPAASVSLSISKMAGQL